MQEEIYGVQFRWTRSFKHATLNIVVMSFGSEVVKVGQLLYNIIAVSVLLFLALICRVSV
jgi:hypothetical protein